MSLTDDDIFSLTNLRHRLHTVPEVSGEEFSTALLIREFLADTAPDHVISNLGGAGIAFVYNGRDDGPTVMLRAELDGLPIEEKGTPAYRSVNHGKGHMCGHDGHMAILAALGLELAVKRPQRGRAVLLFQPAEEIGTGAAAVISDDRFSSIKPDYTFSLHNLPALPLGHIWLKEGTVSCASRGLKIILSGKTAHASMPETGISPVLTVAKLMPELIALSRGTITSNDFNLVTVTHVSIGEPTYGISPGDAEVWVTLRAMTDAQMSDITHAAETIATRLAEEAALSCAFEYHDVFQHSANHPEAVALLRSAINSEQLTHEPGEAMRASEDFGHFGSASRSAMFFLGAGEDAPSLHNPNYDFPDELIPLGARVLMRVTRDLLG